MANYKKMPKKSKSNEENQTTQPLVTYSIFNNSEALTQGWYPLLASKKLRRGQAKSVRIMAQRVVLFRGKDGDVRALDAFCPHFGADLGNGVVIENRIQCRMHHWEFSGDGNVAHIPCQDHKPEHVKLRSYPVEEKFGFLWVFAGEKAAHALPIPPGVGGAEFEGSYLGEVELFAHHHIMMINGIDLQHFSAVHNLDIDFEFESEDKKNGVFDWHLRGALPDRGFKAKLGRWLLGEQFSYSVRFAGGSLVAISYGVNQRFRGKGRLLPALHIVWGCMPQPEGNSKVKIFLLNKKRTGIIGFIKSAFLKALTLGLLTILKDEDVKAFPNFRFSPTAVLAKDKSVARLIGLIETLPLSLWAKQSNKGV